MGHALAFAAVATPGVRIAAIEVTHHLLVLVPNRLPCSMLLRLLALALVSLLGRSAFAGWGVAGAPWTGGSRWEATAVSPAHPATRVSVSQGVPAAPVWRTVRPGPSAAVSHSLPDALHASWSSGTVTRHLASLVHSGVRSSDAGRLAFPYDATAPPGA